METVSPLVSLEDAKAHLRVDGNLEDGDIQLKLDAATTIILDYLKGRAHEAVTTGEIDASSVASPTVITTVSPHGSATNDTVFISGHVDSVPSINGTRVVTVVSSTTFTIPVAVTIAGTGGTVSKVWAEDTVPGPVYAAILLQLSYLHGFRGDAALERRIEAGDEDGLAPGVAGLLRRFRDPALA